MKEYNNFIGIDIGKFNFVAASYNSKQTKEYKNDAEGIEQSRVQMRSATPRFSHNLVSTSVGVL